VLYATLGISSHASVVLSTHAVLNTTLVPDLINAPLP
jgi:hypothetical protein